MAKRSRNNRARRETSVSRYQQMPVLVSPRPMGWKSPTLKTTLQVLEDRRTWNPARWSRPVAVALQNRKATQLVVARAHGNLLPSRVAFKDPRRVVVCLRRKARREVLLALGKGGGGNKAPKRKPTSEVTC